MRRAVKLLNIKICLANRTAHEGPTPNLSVLDPDAVVREWRSRRRT